MAFVRAKKHLGQHFLKDETIASKIVAMLKDTKNLLEIGPGMGVLTKYLIGLENCNLKIIEIDKESVAYLIKNYPVLEEKIISADFLRCNLNDMFDGTFSIIGNFPYNISSQILFKVLENKDKVNEVVGMFQKEVAVRIASKPGNKDYGILSVFMQTYFEAEYLFTVSEDVFIPPPKVKSAVVRFTRVDRKLPDFDEKLFFALVKTAFNQRRKTLRNALSSFTFIDNDIVKELFPKRAEQLGHIEFIELTRSVIK